MTRGRLTLMLTTGLVASLAAHVGLFFVPTGRNWEVMPEMYRSPASESYAENRFFPDRKTLQLPPEDTVAREQRPFLFGPSEEEAVRAGSELKMPSEYQGEERAVRGRKVFETFCTPCHGRKGLGDGLVIQRGFPAPPSLRAEHARRLPDGRLFHILTRGQKNMPAYAAVVSVAERWEVIRYLRELQQKEEPE